MGIGIVIGICIAVAAPATVLICACLKGNESEDTKYYSTFYKGMYRFVRQLNSSSITHQVNIALNFTNILSIFNPREAFWTQQADV